MRRPPVLLVALLSVSMLSAACGLKQEQKDALKAAPGVGSVNSVAGGSASGGGGAGGGAAGGGATTPGGSTASGAAVPGSTIGGGNSTAGGGSTTGGAGGATTSGGGSSSAGGATSSGGGATSSGGGSTSGGGGGTAPGAAAGPVKCGAVKNDDSTGITPTEIRIGIHAPQTGTGAPLPPSFAAGAAVYWKTHKVCGRTVVVDFEDDKYTPSTARDVCGPMSRRNFLVIGAAGTDQIQSCATMPDIAGKGVPYLSAGVTTNGLTDLKNYFATTLTYAQQSQLVFKNAQNQGLGMKKWAVITSQTDNFKDARVSMASVLKAAGVPFEDIQVNATNDSGLQSRAAQTGTKIATGGYDTVYLDTSPGYFIYMAGTAANQGFNGTYTGPGVTMTEVVVAQLVCQSTQTRVKANFLAPYPGIDRATPDFIKATNGSYDDIYWSLWGLSQAIEGALNASSSLTRSGFISSLQKSNLPNGIYTPTKFNGGHFGGTGAFSQKMNCTKSEPNQSQPGSWDTVGGALYK